MYYLMPPRQPLYLMQEWLQCTVFSTDVNGRAEGGFVEEFGGRHISCGGAVTTLVVIQREGIMTGLRSRETVQQKGTDNQEHRSSAWHMYASDTHSGMGWAVKRT